MNPVVYVLIVIGVILQAVFIKVEHDKKYVLADILKGSASLMFVIIGFLALKYNPGAGYIGETYQKRIIAGLICGMIGDILLNLRFVFKKNGQKIFLAGIAVFLSGHILYLLAQLPYSIHPAIAIAIGAALAAALLVYIFKTMDVKPAFKAFGVIYLGAVFVMTCLAIDVALTGNHWAWIRSITADWTISPRLFAIGAVLFTASDIVLIFNTFSGITKFSLRITNLSLYYIGQILIAVSLLFAR